MVFLSRTLGMTIAKENTVKLRNHPEIVRDPRNWPPRWQPCGATARDIPPGETGVLMNVFVPCTASRVCWLLSENDKRLYIAPLYFHDVRSCVRLAATLKKYTGQTIGVIGDMDL